VQKYLQIDSRINFDGGNHKSKFGGEKTQSTKRARIYNCSFQPPLG
jgi:hypothetical protein